MKKITTNKKVKYRGKIDLTNKNNSHTKCFDFIQSFSKGKPLKILEVGCASGYFSKVLIDHNHHVTGIEPDIKSANTAKKVIPNIFIGTFTEFINNTKLDKHFDVIIFGDVLEHLANPEDILQRSKKLLKNDGIIVASIPNISHFAIRAMMLEGKWQYSDLGTLDRTHLKFFTHESIIELFTNSGFEISNMSSVKLGTKEAAMLNNLQISNNSINIVEKNSLDNSGYDFQYVLTATQGKDKKHLVIKNNKIKKVADLNITCILSDTRSPLAIIRLKNPLEKAAQKYLMNLQIVNFKQHKLTDLMHSDLVIFQRLADKKTLQLAKELKLAGKKIVFEIDDYLLNLPDFLSHHDKYLKKMRPSISKLMNASDALSVSTHNLADRLTNFNKNIFITPNYSEQSTRIVKHYDVKPNKVTVICGSSDTVDFSFIVNPLKKLLQKYQFSIIVIGPPGDFLENHGIKVTKRAMMSHVDFKSYISSFDNAIGIIPLDNSDFSSCKSAIKYFDFSTSGLPAVCSNVDPYKSVIQNRVNGLLVDENNAEDWYVHIESLILSSSLRRDLSIDANKSVMNNYNLDLSAEAWFNLISHLDFKSKSKATKIRISKSTYIKNLSESVISLLIKKSSYINLYRTYKADGVKGLFRKITNKLLHFSNY